jgi:hypothetical protein
MTSYPSRVSHDSDFGPTVPGHRSGEGSSSILPYLANTLKVNPNTGALSLAREVRANAERKKKPLPANETVPAPPAVKRAKPARH